MTRLKSAFVVLGIVCLTLLFVSWGDMQRMVWEPIPQMPDYSDSSQWFIRDRGGDADIFYIISTETGDHMIGQDTCHYADTYESVQRGQMEHEMFAVDSFYSSKNINYFSPHYRQASMQSWGSVEMALSRLPLAMSDVRRSWDYYLKHLNHGRPFILAGFSQGAHALLDIMHRMPDSVAKRMVAAYVIGYRVTKEDTMSCKIIRPATGATDTGVTICFNSVKSPESEIGIVSGGNLFYINPVNWRTDTVSASFVLYSRKRNDTLSVSCDPESRLLIVEGFRNERILPVIGKPGNYHNMELKFYYPYIRKNMADRVVAFLQRLEHPLDDD